MKLLRRRPLISEGAMISYSATGIERLRNIRLESSPSDKVNAVTYLVASERLSYSEARKVVGDIHGRSLESADLSVPLRVLKQWSQETDDDVGEIRHIFHPDHLYIITRILAMVYEQERVRHYDLEGVSAFLSLKQLFGDDVGGTTADLRNLWSFAKAALDDEQLAKYLEHTGKDDNALRLRRLGTDMYILPLHEDGALEEIGDIWIDDNEWREHMFKKYDPFPQNTMVYLRGTTIVEATVSNYEMYTETRPISDKFWEKFGDVRMRLKYNVEQHNADGLEALVVDANAGSLFAGAFLLSQTLQGRVVTSKSIFPYKVDGYEEVETRLKSDVLWRLVGRPQYRYHEKDIVLPVRGEVFGELKIGTVVEDEDCYRLEWRDAPDDLTTYACAHNGLHEVELVATEED